MIRYSNKAINWKPPLNKQLNYVHQILVTNDYQFIL